MVSTEVTTEDSPNTWLATRSTPRSDDESVLIVAWILTDGSRIGESTCLPGEGPLLLGRGGPRPDDAFPRVRFFRERPFGSEECGPLDEAAISRQQLRLTPRDGVIDFQNMGRCEVLQNGIVRSLGTLRPGDTLVLKDQLVLLFVRRPPLAVFGDAFPATKAGVFGHADAYGLVGEGAPMWQLRREMALVAAADEHTILLGASGVGKELVARAIHALSERRSGAFVARSAASMPATLVDAELFGNLKNFPNPGMAERPGLIGAANGGTFFLDEAGELAFDLQSHLLRVLDKPGEYHRLGESNTRQSDFRFIAATNRAIDSIKHDFAARLTQRVIIPGLNQRQDDIPLLIRHLMRRAREKAPTVVSRFFHPQKNGLEYPRIAPAFVEALLRHQYTTHIRELEAILWQSIRASRGDFLMPVALEDVPAQSESSLEEVPTKEAVSEALARHHGSAARAYRQLGLSSRYALYRLMKKYGIPPGETGDA